MAERSLPEPVFEEDGKKREKDGLNEEQYEECDRQEPTTAIAKMLRTRDLAIEHCFATRVP